MLALIQRVSQASVGVDHQIIARIGLGILVLVGVEPGDDEARIRRLAERLLGYRLFADQDGKMNRAVTEIGGDLLLVSQFTLVADTASGMRPSFGTAATPSEAEPAFNRLVAICREKYAGRVETGRFGAHMAVSLINDGPVTLLLRP